MIRLCPSRNHIGLYFFSLIRGVNMYKSKRPRGQVHLALLRGTAGQELWPELKLLQLLLYRSPSAVVGSTCVSRNGRGRTGRQWWPREECRLTKAGQAGKMLHAPHPQPIVRGGQGVCRRACAGGGHGWERSVGGKDTYVLIQQ